jgi:hypothetical protein
MSVAVADSQNQLARRDWTADWAQELSVNTSPTIIDADVFASDGATILDHTFSPTSVTYRLEVSSVARGTVVEVAVHVDLSDGEHDVDIKRIRVT